MACRRPQSLSPRATTPARSHSTRRSSRPFKSTPEGIAPRTASPSPSQAAALVKARLYDSSYLPPPITLMSPNGSEMGDVCPARKLVSSSRIDTMLPGLSLSCLWLSHHVCFAQRSELYRARSSWVKVSHLFLWFSWWRTIFFFSKPRCAQHTAVYVSVLPLELN